MRLIKLDENNIVIQVRLNAQNIYDGEFESEKGTIGQKMIQEGVFEDVVPEEEITFSIEEDILTENQYQTFLLENILFGGNE